MNIHVQLGVALLLGKRSVMFCVYKTEEENIALFDFRCVYFTTKKQSVQTATYEED